MEKGEGIPMASNNIVKKSDRKVKGTKRLAAGLVGASLTAALAIGGSIAYLTDTDMIQNQFSLDTNLSIALEEANFDEESAKGLLPTQEVTKDPKVINDGSVDAYIAATVKVPVMTGKVLNADNKIDNVVDLDLYAYELGEGWALYGTPTIEDGFKTYTYIYSDVLGGTAKTNAIFDSVKVVNFTEDPGLDDVNINITAYAIQSHGFNSAEAAYEAYKTQSAAAVIAE